MQQQLLLRATAKRSTMVHQAMERSTKRPPNTAQRPLIWQDGLAEVKETFRRVALVKHAGFSVWEEGRNGPTLERILRWNRQARNLSQLPRSLRAHIPTKVIKELSANRSASGYEKQKHLENVRGMCRRIQSQKSVTERRKNLNDPVMYPVFVRRERRRAYSSPPAPLFYTPHPFKLLYDLSTTTATTSPAACYYYPASAKRHRSSSASSAATAVAYSKLFAARPTSATTAASSTVGAQRRRISSAPAGSRRRPSPSPLAASGSGGGDGRPPSRRTNRSATWRTAAAVAATRSGDAEAEAATNLATNLSNRSTYSDCISLDSMNLPSSSCFDSDHDSYHDLPLQQPAPQRQPPRVSVPKLRLRGGGISPPPPPPLTSASSSGVGGADEEEDELRRRRRRPFTANVPMRVAAAEAQDKRPRSASMAVRMRSSRVTFASPVESGAAWEEDRPPPLPPTPLLPPPHPSGGGGGRVDRLGEEEEDVIIKHSSDPYFDFKASMMGMIRSEGLEYGDRELEELFQYYMELNPKMHHPILARVIRDIRAELSSSA